MESIEPWLVGVFRAPISCLSFSAVQSGPRLANPSNLKQKVRIFKNTELCNPYVTENQILIQIDSATRKDILLRLKPPSKEPRDRNAIQDLPRGFQFRCKDGRHRIEAARSLWGPDYKWVLRLYCADEQGCHLYPSIVISSHSKTSN